MKIIVNRGFDKSFTRIAVFRNAQEVAVCSNQKDYCVFEAKGGDRIVVKLKFLNASALTIASWVLDKGDETFYVSPTRMYRKWELANYKILPYFSLLFLAFRPVVESDGYGWFCAGMVVLTALSLMVFLSCVLNSGVRKKLFRCEKV